jgi:peptidylprolyl isomerase
MVRAKNGDRVAVHYIGTLDNGRIFDSTQEVGPLRFTLGAGEVFPALEAAVCGMAAGEVKNIIPAAPTAAPPGEHRGAAAGAVRRETCRFASPAAASC